MNKEQDVDEEDEEEDSMISGEVGRPWRYWNARPTRHGRSKLLTPPISFRVTGRIAAVANLT